MITRTERLSPSLEAEFQTYLNDEKIKLTRIMSLLSSLLFGLFFFVDIWALPTSLSDSLIIRGIVISVLFLTFSSTFHGFFPRHYQSIVALTYMVATSGILALVYLATPKEFAYNIYFAGVMLILITQFSWTYLKLPYSLALASFAICGYILIELLTRNLTVVEQVTLFVSSVFFLASAVIIGLIGQFMRDKYLKENFLLQRSLHNKVEKKTEEAELHEHHANHDPLTGLPNRRFAKQKLEKFLEQAKDLDMSLVIIYLDLNGFKKINDIYGHHAGDLVLKIIASRLQSCLRNGDIVSRLGGDEFAIGLLIEKKELAQADALKEKIQQAIFEPIAFEGQQLQVSSSIGVASYPVNGNQVNVLLDIADKRMYQHKQLLKQRNNENESEVITKKKKDLRQVLIFPR